MHEATFARCDIRIFTVHALLIIAWYECWDRVADMNSRLKFAFGVSFSWLRLLSGMLCFTCQITLLV